MRIASNNKQGGGRYTKFEDICIGQVFVDESDYLVYIKAENKEDAELAVVISKEQCPEDRHALYRIGETHEPEDFYDGSKLVVIHGCELLTSFFD